MSIQEMQHGILENKLQIILQLMQVCSRPAL